MARQLPQFKAAVVIAAVLLIVYFCAFNSGKLRLQRSSISYGNGMPCDHSSSSVPFTVEERLYLKYGGNVSKINPRDKRYLDLIRSQISSPVTGKPRRLTAGSPGQHEKFVEKRLGGRRNGFFIECGANDGEFQSNTAYFETHLGWTGLLVEANPKLTPTLLSRNRQAFVYDGCLSPTKQPATMKFKSAGCCGGLVDHLTNSQDYLIALYSPHNQQVDLVQCYPLGDLLAAIGIKHVDYLSLDIHGAELPVLKTIDFHEIRIDILTIECYDKNATQRMKMAQDIVDLFAKTGLYKPIEIGPGDLVVERINATLP